MLPLRTELHQKLDRNRQVLEVRAEDKDNDE